MPFSSLSHLSHSNILAECTGTVCKIFILIQPVEKNPKIYPQSVECILIGSAPASKAYCCFHKPSNKVVESFHVRFIERKDSIDHPLQPGVIVNPLKIPASDPILPPLAQSIPVLAQSAPIPVPLPAADPPSSPHHSSCPILLREFIISLLFKLLPLPATKAGACLKAEHSAAKDLCRHARLELQAALLDDSDLAGPSLVTDVNDEDIILEELLAAA
ncbi:hypothetical protein F5146DRAFT_1132642 [Armillaria mellea]|nr:hypothetical protein F5146DRAFT_1132642 [Armillaria mellea]